MKVEIDENSGFCFGVVNAIAKAEEELQHGRLYCIGDIVHNSLEVERLKQLGLSTIDHDEFARLKACRVLFRAHGEPPSSYELAKKNDDQLTIFRRRNIGFIFQNYNLVPILNVYENIVLPVELDGDTVAQRFMDEIVGMLALEDKLKNMPNNLSGGQQQRVAIARALITKPAIVLADEPTGNLDSKTSADVLGLLKRTSMEFHQTIVMITHNNEIAQLADRIVRIEDGKIVE